LLAYGDFIEYGLSQEHYSSNPIESKGVGTMKLNAPKTITWIICLICAVIGILATLNIIVLPTLSAYVIWIVIGGLVLLLLATLLPGL
jgi:hypothetical protein